MLVRKIIFRAWEDGSVFKGACCSVMRSQLDASIYVEWLTNLSNSSSRGPVAPSGLVRHSYTCAQTNTHKYSEISLKGNIYRFEL